MLSIMNIGTSALNASQSALSTISNNIANVNTPGYTRQEVELSAIASGLNNITGSSGGGVTVSEVSRLYDSFTTLQLRTEQSNASYWDSYSGVASDVQNIFGEPSNNGTSTAISDFFNAWQTLSQNPQGAAERNTLLSKAQFLSSSINTAYNTLTSQQTQLYKTAQDQVTQANNITQQIYKLNGQIQSAPGALDLKDQRDSLVEQLNQLMKTNTVIDNQGNYDVYVGGQVLVDTTGSHNITVSLDTTTNKMSFVAQNAYGNNTDITAQMQGGSLTAIRDARDTTIAGYMSQLNAFTINLSDSVNGIHDNGYDLNGVKGTDFFAPQGQASSSTGATPILSLNVADPKAFNTDQYAVQYTAATNTFTAYDLTTGSANPITCTATPSGNNTTVSFNGINLVLGGNKTTMLADETFTTQFSQNAAANMAVAITDPNKIAAAQTTPSPGDNSNAQAIAALANQSLVGTNKPVDYYASIVSAAGADSQNATTYSTFEANMVTQLQNQRQSTSGVNLDEEASNLLEYQKSYEAAAKLVTVGNDLLTTLMTMIQ